LIEERSSKAVDFRNLDPRNFDRFAYLRDSRLPLDTSSIGRRNGRYGLPFRKNDSLNDLHDDKHFYDQLNARSYRSEHNRFPHHHSMRESRRDVHDRLDSERRAYSGYNKGDQYNFRRNYDNEGLPLSYRDGVSAREYFARDDEYHEKLKRAGGSFFDSSYHHSLPRKDMRGMPYSDRYSSRFPPSPAPQDPPNSRIYDTEGRRRGRYPDDRYDYQDDVFDGNMSESVLPRMKLKSNVRI